MADLSRLFTFTNGTVADPTQVNAELNQILARLNDVDPDSLLSALADVLGVSQTGVPRRGKAIIPAAQIRDSAVSGTGYGLLATPDRVSGIVVPADALVFMSYQARWLQTVAAAARAAFFIGTNQLKYQTTVGAGPTTSAAMSNFAGQPAPLLSAPFGLVVSNESPSYAADVTTGQALALHTGAIVDLGGTPTTITGGAVPTGGLCVVDNLAAGTYDFSVQFKASSGTVQASERRFKVWVVGF